MEAVLIVGALVAAGVVMLWRRETARTLHAIRRDVAKIRAQLEREQ